MIRNEALLATLKGPPISILICFLICGPQAVLKPTYIARRTGYSRDATYRGLYFLHDHGYTHCLGEHLGWVLTQLAYQQVGALLDHLSSKDMTLPRPQMALETQSVILDDKTVILDDSPSSSSIHTQDQKQTTTTTDSKTVILDDTRSELVTELERAGVYPAAARELAADPWVTAERIQSWIQRLSNDPTVRSLPSVLYTNLRHHLEPGPVGAAQSPRLGGGPHDGRRPSGAASAAWRSPTEPDRRRYIEGEYADWIEH